MVCGVSLSPPPPPLPPLLPPTWEEEGEGGGGKGHRVPFADAGRGLLTWTDGVKPKGGHAEVAPSVSVYT